MIDTLSESIILQVMILLTTKHSSVSFTFSVILGRCFIMSHCTFIAPCLYRIISKPSLHSFFTLFDKFYVVASMSKCNTWDYV